MTDTDLQQQNSNGQSSTPFLVDPAKFAVTHQPKVLMIDNYDSFTYNLVQELLQLGGVVDVVRNDAFTMSDIERDAPDGIIISPGPGRPEDAGRTNETIEHFAGKIPIFGVCLGHQAITQVFGGNVVRADTLMHGKVSPMSHTNAGVFEGLPNPFEATRYHSLVAERSSFPDVLEVTAWTKALSGDAEDPIMGLRHVELDVEGVQFHPESILTRYGMQLLGNFLGRIGSK